MENYKQAILTVLQLGSFVQEENGMNVNKSVVIYGAGFLGGRYFLALAEENVHVEAFCDKDADRIPLYFGCDVLTCEEAVKRYPALPFIVSVDNAEERKRVTNQLKETGIEVYGTFREFFPGLNDAAVETVYCGEAAGFQIVPSFLQKKENLTAYSFGICFDFSFEMELVQKYGMAVYAFDPSPEVIEEMKGYDLPEKLKYYPYGLSDEDAKKIFYCPSPGTDYSEYFVSWTGSDKTQMQVYRLSTLMGKLGHDHLDILKMDVEGSEFLALPDILNMGIDFDQLCIETHTRIFPDSVEKMRSLKKLLNSHGYLLVSNERQEQTYIRKNLLEMK